MCAARVVRRICALAVLVCQLGLLATVPIALCRIGPVETASAVICTCEHEPGAECPMHKGRTSAADETSAELRLCAGCGDEASAIVSASAGAPGILGRDSSAVDLMSLGAASTACVESLLTLADPPISPPPRGQVTFAEV